MKNSRTSPFLRTRHACSNLFVVTICLLASRPLSAQQRAAPSLDKVMDEGLAASKELAEAKGASNDEFMVQYALTFALVGSGQRQLVDGLFSDPSKKQQMLELAEGQLVEFTGKPPKIKPGTPAIAEAIQRQQFAIALAKRGDFKGALEQVAAFPKDERVASLVVRAYQTVVKQQLDKPDLAGARQTNRLTWASIQKLKDSRRKAERLIDLAESTSQAGEKAAAQKICLTADKMLQQLTQKQVDPRDAIYSLRRLATAFAKSGNIARARELLTDYKQRVESIQDPSDKAEYMSDMEVDFASVAVQANEREEALRRYARALDWAMKTNQNPVGGQGGDLDEFVSNLVALGSGATFRTIALGQFEAGDKRAAQTTLKKMPLSLQKMATLLELAKRLQMQGRKDEARQLAKQCEALCPADAPAVDLVTVTAFAANIHRTLGDDEAARRTIKKLTLSPRLKQSLPARKQAAAELADFQLFVESYNLIQTLKSAPDRALPLAKLAENMVKARYRRP